MEVVKVVDKRIIKTKNSLKSSLINFLETKKLEEITIIELTQDANVNRKTFYLHYKKVSSVLEDIEQEVISKLKDVIVSYNLHIDSLEQFIYDVFNVIMQDEYAKALIQKTKYHKNILNSLEKILIDECEQKYKDVNEHTSATLKYTIAHHVFGSVRLFCHWLRKNQNLDLEVFSKFLNSLVLNGIRELFNVR